MGIISLPLTLVKLKNSGFHIHTILKALNKSINCVVDTGASHTAFDTLFIEKLVTVDAIRPSDDKSVSPGDTDINFFHVTVESIILGEIEITNAQCITFDFTNINTSYRSQGINEVSCILGSDLLTKLRAVIDLHSMELRIST